MVFSNWLSNNYIEIFGAVTGIVFVFLEIRQNIWLWPFGIVTSAVYIWVFFTGKLYADMSLQWYYLGISCLGWYWWVRGPGQSAPVEERSEKIVQSKNIRKDEILQGERERPVEGENKTLQVTRLKLKTGVVLAFVFGLLYAFMWIILSRFTDSPVPGWDSFLTSLSIVATWMLARKIYEHWLIWIVVNSVAVFLFLARGLYPTVVLYMVYGIMSFVGLAAWKKTIKKVY